MPCPQEGRSIYLESLEMLIINHLPLPRTNLSPLTRFFLPPSLLVILMAFIFPFHSALQGPRAPREGLLYPITDHGNLLIPWTWF